MIIIRRTAVNFVVNFWIKCSTVGHLDKQHSTTQSTGKKMLTNTSPSGDSFKTEDSKWTYGSKWNEGSKGLQRQSHFLAHLHNSTDYETTKIGFSEKFGPNKVVLTFLNYHF